MAEETGVGEKTIRRDLNVFREIGFPIEEAVGPHGRKTWRLKPLQHELPMSFTCDEAMALYLGRQLLEPLAGTFFWQAAQAV
jgi:predicted DNA-binding transcriptional regulator YafY